MRLKRRTQLPPEVSVTRLKLRVKGGCTPGKRRNSGPIAASPTVCDAKIGQAKVTRQLGVTFFAEPTVPSGAAPRHRAAASRRRVAVNDAALNWIASQNVW